MTSSLEKEILEYGLIIGIVFQFYQTIISLVPVLYQLHVFINILITLVLIFLLFLTQRRQHVQLVAFSMHVMVLSASVFFWSVNGGMAGSVPSFLCVYIAFIVTTSHGGFLWVTLLLFGSMMLVFFGFFSVLGMDSFYEPLNTSTRQTSQDFLVIAVLILVFVLFLKRKFLFYREQVALRHQQLKQIAKTLEEQNQELATREEETRAINDNLGQLVHDRTREVENKNKALSEFAFINAHMLRGPLCRIIGLLQIMEKDPQHDAAQLHALKKITREIDAEISVISKLLN